jgi:hypothetical protein
VELVKAEQPVLQSFMSASPPMPVPATGLSSTTSNLRARVLYNFTGSTANEMNLVAGQVIEVVRRGPAGGWSKGLTGAFPADFVEYLPAAPLFQSNPVTASATSGSAGSLLDFGFATGTATGVQSSAGSMSQSTGFTSTATNSGMGTMGLGAKSTTGPDKFDAFADIASTTTPLTASTASSVNVSANLSTNHLTNVSATTPALLHAQSPFTASSVSLGSFSGGIAQSSSSSSQASSLGNVSSPVNSVSSESAADQTAAAKPSKPKVYATVKYARIAQGSTELTIAIGDEVEVIKQDSEWWYGSIGDGAAKKTGFFPGNYVQLKDSGAVAGAGSSASMQSASPALDSTSPYASPNQYQNSTNYSQHSDYGSSAETPQYKSSNPTIRLPRRAVKEKIITEMTGESYALDPMEGSEKCPIWHLPFFLDLFADEYKSSIVGDDGASKLPAIARLKYALFVVKTALHRVNVMEQVGDGVQEVLMYAIKVINEGYENTNRVPANSKDPTRFFTYLTTLMSRIRTLQESESTIVPTAWVYEDGTEQAVLVVVTRTHEGTGTDFSVSVVNTGDNEKGLKYHASNVDPGDGSILRNVAFEICNIPNDKVFNTAFWFIFSRTAIMPLPKYGCKFFYEKVLPFLSSMPILSALNVQNSQNVGTNDFRGVPAGGDVSFINCVLESLRYIGRFTGLTDQNADHLLVLVKWECSHFLLNDLQVVKSISPIELDIVRIAVNSLARNVGLLAGRESTFSGSQLSRISDLVTRINKRLDELKPPLVSTPLLDLTLASSMNVSGAGEWQWFGRLRQDTDIEKLAGEAPLPPILRPTELTLVPESVHDFNSAAVAMRHALNLCVLLSNQRELVRNSYTLRVCLVEHLFVRVIPLPLPVGHPDRDQHCFWHAQPIRYETQADLLRLLSMLSRHFATASLSVKATRSGDAIRMLTCACMATIGDALLRKIATDVPSQASLHYAGLAPGPVQPFGFELGSFSEESEYLKFSSPETATARTQVLDYFHKLQTIVQADHVMFAFERTSECSPADKRYMDQVCVQLGFVRGQEAAYFTGVDPLVLDHYPEIGFFRDLVFMFKLVMVPTSDKLPELRPWMPTDGTLKWSLDATAAQYIVGAFGRKLDCKQESLISIEEQQVQQIVKRKGFFSKILRFVGAGQRTFRSIPSQANPSILVGERVDTEDDILHVRVLPDFDGTLGARDCELLLQYLSAPYLRIPLILNFFSVELRLKSLRTRSIQEVLDAALFEPGQWKEEDTLACPTVVPAPSRAHLCTTVGLLFNEIIMAPHVILNSVKTMLEKVIEMDTGKYSELGEAILYVVRMAVRVEGYLLFLVRNRDFHKKRAQQTSTEGATWLNGAYQHAQVRGLACGDSVIADALQCQQQVRNLLDEKVFRIIARWTVVAKREGLMSQACMLHAHLAFLYRNVEETELTPRIVFTSLASQIFIFNNYKYDLDIELKEHKRQRTDVEGTNSDLGVPQVELFDMFQRNRTKILNWLVQNKDLRNSVMDAIVQLVEEQDSSHRQEDTRVTRNWVTVHHPGLNFNGRFVPDTEFDVDMFDAALSPEARVNFEAWLRDTTTLAIKTEINVQLGEFTIKKHATRPLEMEYKEFEEFDAVFNGMTRSDVIQCAEVKHTEFRQWVRLVGYSYDLQLWTPDTRRPAHGFKRAYDTCSDVWLKEIIDPWKDRLFPSTPLFMSADKLDDAVFTILRGYSPSATPNGAETLKEIIVYRYPPVFHVFNVVEYGRRWYRSQIFSSDSNVTYHGSNMFAVNIGKKSYQCCGDPQLEFQRTPSLVIHRFKSDGLGRQTYMPSRLLCGILPSHLLSTYSFWQNEDNSIMGYLPPSKANSSVTRSIIHCNVQSQGSGDTTGFGNSLAVALVTRICVLDKPGIDPYDFENNNQPDPAKRKMHLVDLLAILRHFALPHTEAELCEPNTLISFQGEDSTLHALVRILLRLDTLGNILAWSYSDPADEGGNVSVDLIELPRLRLTFERRSDIRVNTDGTRTSVERYFCLEQSGLFLAGYQPHLKFSKLLEGLTRVVLLANADDEYFALLSAIAKPSLTKLKGSKNAYSMVYNLSSADWIDNTGESTYFLYPVHASGCFLSSKSVGSSMYLLVLRLMSRMYKEAFRLIESCVCDLPFTPQEQQIYDLISLAREDLHADVHACRLKLFFVSFGCSDIMKFQFIHAEEMLAYISKHKLVSSSCRLSPEEEIFVLSRIPPEFKNLHLHMVNRERLINASFNLSTEVQTVPTGKFCPVYPPVCEITDFVNQPVDFDSLDTTKSSFKNFLSKLSIVKYNKTESLTGPAAITYLMQVLDEDKNVGFFYLYDLFTNSSVVSIIPDDKAHGVGAILLRFSPNDFIVGVQSTILRIMEAHPDLCAKMPIFEDKRKLKLPTIAGLDVFQSHIKACAAFLKQSIPELNETRLFFNIPLSYKAPAMITSSVCANTAESRQWIGPLVTDYNCPSKEIKVAAMPRLFHSLLLSRFSDQELTHLVTVPLETLGLSRYIGLRKNRDRPGNAVSAKSHISVLEHPSSRSYIARTSVTRLEKDIADFAVDENDGEVAVLADLNSDLTISVSVVEQAAANLNSLAEALAVLRAQDTQSSKAGIEAIVNHCNGSAAVERGDVRALGHSLLQKAGSEAALVRKLLRIAF